MNNETETKDANNKGSNDTTITNLENKSNATRGRNKRGKVLKRKRGMAKMIIIGTRVLRKYSELIENPWWPNFQRLRD